MPTANTTAKKYTRPYLGGLLLIVALNAFGGGYYGMAGAENVPLAWLEGSPFSNYFIPSFFLFVIIGGLSLTASLAVFFKKKYAWHITVLCGIAILLWIAIQLSIIGYVSWMQPATTIAAIVILILNHQLRKA